MSLYKKSLLDNNGKPSTKRIIGHRSFWVLVFIAIVDVGYTILSGDKFPDMPYIIFAAILGSALGLSIFEFLGTYLKQRFGVNQKTDNGDTVVSEKSSKQNSKE